MRKQIPVKIMAIVTCIGMFLVLLQGALVTQTESGRGCGDDWPLCHGKFVPAYTLESIIEYSHRIISGVVGLLVIATTIAIFLRLRQRDARIYAVGALFFTLLQAALGAAQVMNPQSDVILALHFGFSLLAFTFTLLIVTSVSAALKAERARDLAEQAIQPVQVTRKFKLAVWLTTIYTYFVVYTGALTSHTDSAGGCIGFPLCNGEIIPSNLAGVTAVAFTHRSAAYLLFIFILILALFARKIYASSSEIRLGATWALVLVIGQLASGALMMALIGTDAYIFGTLLHTIIIAVLFAVLSYLSIAVYRKRSMQS
jgi:cytochrome c oxidase assembly protein subunit 15